LYQKKEYGEYAENGKMPVFYRQSYHWRTQEVLRLTLMETIGLNFDRCGEGTMSDIYDPSI
jgi:hypothetical protein